MKHLTIAMVGVALLVGSTFAGIVGGGNAAAQTGADVTVSIKADRHSVRAGRDITFTITATNVGSEAAQNVVVSGWQPDWFNFVASGCGSNTVLVTSTGPLSCAVGVPDILPIDLLPGQSATLTLVLTTFNNPKQDRNNAYELGFVSWGPDPNNPSFQNEARVNVQIAGKPG